MPQKPLPYNVLKMTGQTRKNPGKYKDREVEPKTGTSLVKPKSVTGEAAKQWKRVVEWMTKLGIADGADTALIELHCDTWSQYIRYRQMEADGVSPNISFSATVRLREQMLKQLSEMGLTPVARVRLAKPKEEVENPLQKLRSKRG